MPRPDLYAVLGISEHASRSEIRRAYRVLADRWHPDHNDGSAEATARFQEIAAAYAVLYDPDDRESYDRERKAPPPEEPPYGRRYRPGSILGEHRYVGEFDGAPHYHAGRVGLCPLCGLDDSLRDRGLPAPRSPRSPTVASTTRPTVSAAADRRLPHGRKGY